MLFVEDVLIDIQFLIDCQGQIFDLVGLWYWLTIDK